jgi:hypothetical protein
MPRARTPKPFCALVCLLLLGCLPGLALAGPKGKAALAPCKAEDDKPTFDHRPVLLKAMEAELQRSMQSLRIEGFEAPYFMAFALEETQSNRIQARSGALDSSGGGKNRRLRVEVRVGNHELPSTSPSPRATAHRATRRSTTTRSRCATRSGW